MQFPLWKFAHHEKFLTEGNEGNKETVTQRIRYLRSLRFLMFNYLVAASGRVVSVRLCRRRTNPIVF